MPLGSGSGGATTQPPPDHVRRVAGRRLDVLTQLREAGGPLPIAELARRLAVHPNTVRFHLDALLDAGLVQRVDGQRRAPGRPALLFAAVPGMDPGGPRRYQQLAHTLAGALDDGPDGPARALQAGRAWGRAVAAPDATPGGGGTADGSGDDGSGAGGSGASGASAGRAARRDVDRLMSLLDDLDFDPVLLAGQDGDLRIGLRRCPFLEVAAARSAVVCPVHLGLMQGAMQVWAGPTTVHRLEPFAEPELCLAHLGPAGEAQALVRASGGA